MDWLLQRANVVLEMKPIQPVAVLSPHKFVTLPNLFKVDSQPETTEAAQGGKHTSPQIIS